MKIDHLDAMVRGWFVGDFDPAVLKTGDCEVAVQRYRAGDYEPYHHHKVATEITVIVSGEAVMGGRTVRAGEIVTIPPGTSVNFTAVSDVTAVVVKTPSVKGDKYLD